MNSRERLLNALHRQPVDHVPLWLRFWSMNTGIDNFPFPWRDQVVRAENLVQRGLDDTLLLEPPLGYVENYLADQAPGVESNTEYTPPIRDEKYPHLTKTYHTPGGDLEQSIKITEDWPHGQELRLFSDFNVSRYIKPMITSLEDVKRFRYLLADPSPDQVRRYRQSAQVLRQHAQRLGVALEGGWTALGDSLVWLLGMEGVLYGQMDNPILLESLLDVLLEWELKRLNFLAEEGVDFVTHMAWYEGVDFWTPRSYRRFLKLRLKSLVEQAHSRGLPVRYIITKGWKPLRADLVEIGVDCLAGVDPVQDNLDLAEVKREIGDRVCLMGGVNSSVMFTQWSEEAIRQAVKDAFRILAPGGGFILYPVDQVFSEMEWGKIQVLIDEWGNLTS